MRDETSPAVESLEHEKASQRLDKPGNDLQKGLEDTFPASDPVSITQTSQPAGRVDRDDAEHQHRMNRAQDRDNDDSDVPNVISALNEHQRETEDENLSPEEKVEHLKSEVRRLQDRLARNGGQAVATGSGDVVTDIKNLIRSRPLKAIAGAGLIGYLWGMSR
ncbi:hypothetical protein [Rhizobium paknamense]|uniref:ElaB/YqjD/DUF883 family membrane-anchored ribosome-binding protein n=1 Tax=Rhizobium paknamense TaxID=1206817 RepID=A0ABU0IG12_9HYPH|nr:hypothetical protein [Rhizobium paknamense]MDQ0456365.1 ElaB/YqjD/DUF883 family membrane-anchored ribosome-binding protein [Rhizobium paknamense]